MKGQRVAMGKPGLAAILIVALTVVLSFLPLMQPSKIWTGYGSLGSHFYRNELYEIHYGDVSTGVGKPQIYLLLGHDRTPMVEVSDRRSEINWQWIHPNFPEQVRVDGDTLISTYGGGLLTKKVEPKGDTVQVFYTLAEEANLTITLWRWYYSSVENITKYNLSTAELAPSKVISYTFNYSGGQCSCEVVSEPIPHEVSVLGDEEGINKITLLFREANRVSLTFRTVKKPSGAAFLSLSSPITYPIVAVIVAGSFLILSFRFPRFRLKYPLQWLSNHGKRLLKPKYLALLAFGIRIALAPFFMHVWDVTTVQEAMNDFISGRNVYSAVAERTAALRLANGVEADYEGFAYLPHPIPLYLPFYHVYLGFFGNDPAIIGGHYEAPLQLITPNIYFFLLLMKLPVVLADSLAAYLLARKNVEIGLLYALLPYSIMVTSVWGQFDPLVGLFLLLAVLTASKRPFASGLFYGLSLMKLFVVSTFPAFMLLLQRDRKTCSAFLLGLFVSQLPTIIFLVQDSNAMVSVLFFHSARSPGGVNLYNLAPKLYCYQLQATMNRIAFAILGFAVLAVLVKGGRGLGVRGVIFSLAAYMAVGPVVNEQYLATLLPLLLMFDYYGLAFALSTGYSAYALLYSRPAYFTAPLEALLGCGLTDLLEDSWNSLFGAATPQLLYAIAVGCSLMLLSAVRNGLAGLKDEKGCENYTFGFEG